MNETDLKRIFPNASPTFLKANCSTPSLAPDPEHKRDPGNGPLAEAPREKHNPGRRLVIVKSFRRVLLDERNLFEKYFVDALVSASIIYDDSPRWAKIEVYQFQIHDYEVDHTTITIYDL